MQRKTDTDRGNAFLRSLKHDRDIVHVLRKNLNYNTVAK